MNVRTVQAQRIKSQVTNFINYLHDFCFDSESNTFTTLDNLKPRCIEEIKYDKQPSHLIGYYGDLYSEDSLTLTNRYLVLRCIEEYNSNNRPTLSILKPRCIEPNNYNKQLAHLASNISVLDSSCSLTLTIRHSIPRCIEQIKYNKQLSYLSSNIGVLNSMGNLTLTIKHSIPRCIEPPPPPRKLKKLLSKKAPPKTGLSYFWAIKNHPPP